METTGFIFIFMYFILQLYFVFVLSCLENLPESFFGEAQKAVETFHCELHVIKYSIIYASDYSLYLYLLDYILLLIFNLEVFCMFC